jgi:hypothetical protein
MNQPSSIPPGRRVPLASSDLGRSPDSQALLDDWFLSIGDGKSYGPYSFAQLIEFAKDGRVDEASVVLHTIATKNSWLSAKRIKGLAPHIITMPVAPILPPMAVEHDAAPARIRAARRNHQKTGGMRWLKDVVPALISVGFLALLYHQYQDSQLPSKPSLASVQTVTPPEVVPSKAEAPMPNRPSVPPPSARISRPPYKSPAAPAPVAPTPTDKRNDGNLSELLKDEEPKATNQERLLEVALDLSDGRHIVALPELQPNRRLKANFTGAGFRSGVMIPADGIVSEQGRLEFLPQGDHDVFFAVKAIVEDKRMAKLSIECQTSLEWLGGDDLSALTLKRKRVAMVKSLAALVNGRNSALSEANKLAMYVESRTAKPLQAVGQAKDRILQLQPMIANFNTQITAQELAIAQFDSFCVDLEAMLKGSTLILEVVQ